MATETTQHEQLVRDYVAWVNGDSTGSDVLWESVDVYNPGLPEGEVHGRAEYDAYLRKIRSGFSDLHFAPEAVVSGGDVVMVEFTITGTHDGPFRGVPPTGRDVEIRGVEKFRVADDRVREIRVFYDTREIPEQLGLTFPTVVGQLPKLAWRKIS